MMEIDHACEACHESMESYITGDLSDSEAREVASHIAECTDCAALYAARRELIGALKAVPDGMQPVRPAFVAPSPRARDRRVSWWQTATAAAAALAVFSISALTVPAFAAIIPGLPVSAQIERLEAERDRLAAETESLNERVQELEIEMKEIGGETVPVVDSAGEGAVSSEINDAVQRLGMDFIRAQYRGDKAALKELSTERLAAMIDDDPDQFLKKPGEVVFAQMTTVAKTEDGTLLLFVRLSDAEFSDSTFQENFEIKFEGGRYLVDFMGMDA